MLARPLLADPHWPYAAAKALGIENPVGHLAASLCALARPLSCQLIELSARRAPSSGLRRAPSWRSTLCVVAGGWP